MRQALELALEALQDYVDEYGPWSDDSGAQYALRVGKEALAQPEQEPEWYHIIDVHGCNRFYHKTEDCPYECRTPLYTTPPQRTWVGLTDEEIADCAEKMEASDPTDSFWREFFRGIEAKLKDKNT